MATVPFTDSRSSLATNAGHSPAYAQFLTALLEHRATDA